MPVRRTHRSTRAIFLRSFLVRLKPKMGIAVFDEDAARSPWHNGYVERLIRSIRRKCVDYIIGFELGALAPCPETPPVCITTKLAPMIAGYGAVQFSTPNRFGAQTDSTAGGAARIYARPLSSITSRTMRMIPPIPIPP